MNAKLALLVVLVGCDRPDTAVVCHNANCVEPADPENDVTLETMRESLALELDGKPVIDGMELDTFWRGADAQCVFAHDLERAPTSLAVDAATELAAHFARPGPITYEGRPFLVLVELKAHVAASTSVRHTAEQRVQHAMCAWEIYRVLSDAALANARDIEVIFSSFEPKLVQAMIDAAPTATPTPFSYGGLMGVPRPLDSETRDLGEYGKLPIRVVEVHPQWLLDGAYEAIESAGYELAFFMFSATVETFDLTERYEPIYVSTSEAQLYRRWLER